MIPWRPHPAARERAAGVRSEPTEPSAARAGDTGASAGAAAPEQFRHRAAGAGPAVLAAGTEAAAATEVRSAATGDPRQAV